MCCQTFGRRTLRQTGLREGAFSHKFVYAHRRGGGKRA